MASLFSSGTLWSFQDFKPKGKTLAVEFQTGERAILNGEISWYCLINTKEKALSSILEVLVLLQPPHPATKRRQLQVLRKSKEESSLLLWSVSSTVWGGDHHSGWGMSRPYSTLLPLNPEPRDINQTSPCCHSREALSFLNTDIWMNGLAKRKGKSLLSNYLHPLSKKKMSFLVFFFPPNHCLVWNNKNQKKTKNKKPQLFESWANWHWLI